MVPKHMNEHEKLHGIFNKLMIIIYLIWVGHTPQVNLLIDPGFACKMHVERYVEITHSIVHAWTNNLTGVC